MRVQSVLQIGDEVSDGARLEGRIVKHLGYAVIARMNTGAVCVLVARVPSLNGKQNHDVILTLKGKGAK